MVNFRQKNPPVRLEMSDRSFNRIEFLDNEYEDLKWDFLVNGGCGNTSFKLPRKYCQELNIAPDFNIKLYRRNASTQSYDLWYQGYIDDKIVDTRQANENLPVVVVGYFSQLERILIDTTYSSQEVSAIVKNILDNYVTPNTDISYDAGDIEATGFTADDIEFNAVTCKEALQTLADLVNFEHGVDKDRKYYFKAKSTTVGHRFSLGARCTRFYDDYASKEIKNRVVIKGGDVSGSAFQATYDDTQSQLKWGRRDMPVHNTAIVSSTVAQQYANAIFAERAEVVRRGNAEIIEIDERIEQTLPVPLMQIVVKGITYGERKYGTFLYSGRVSYAINRISYRLMNNYSVLADIEIGKPKPTMGQTIAKIEHRLEQARSQGL